MQYLLIAVDEASFSRADCLQIVNPLSKDQCVVQPLGFSTKDGVTSSLIAVGRGPTVVEAEASVTKVIHDALAKANEDAVAEEADNVVPIDGGAEPEGDDKAE